jgi:hypothetical protein
MTDSLVIPLVTAARLLGLSADALRMRGRRGQFPLVADDQGRLLVRTTDLEAYLDRLRPVTQAPAGIA